MKGRQNLKRVVFRSGPKPLKRYSEKVMFVFLTKRIEIVPYKMLPDVITAFPSSYDLFIQAPKILEGFKTVFIKICNGLVATGHVVCSFFALLTPPFLSDTESKKRSFVAFVPL